MRTNLKWLALAAVGGMFFTLQLAPSPVQPLVRSTSVRPVHLQIAGMLK